MWDIIIKLYPERDPTLNSDTLIHDEDSYSETGGLIDSQNSSLIKSVGNSLPNEESSSEVAGDYSIFSLNNLKIIPDGSPAVYTVNKNKSVYSLTLLPSSERSDKSAGFGALPNMKTRAEMFNQLAIGVNLLTEARVIRPTVMNVRTTEHVRTWFNQDVGAQATATEPAIPSSVYGNQELQMETNANPNSYFESSKKTTSQLYSLSNTFQLKAGTYIRPHQTKEFGSYTQSEEISQNYQVGYQTHPYFINATSNLNPAKIVLGKILTKLETQIGSCGEAPADRFNQGELSVGGYYMLCPTLFPYRKIEHGIEESKLPTQIVTSSFEYVVINSKKNFSNTLKIDKPEAKVFSVYSSAFKNAAGTDKVCFESCATVKKQIFHQVAPYFYPSIVKA